jgi:hypothetical protein
VAGECCYIINILQKSLLGSFEFQVIESHNLVEAKPEPFAPNMIPLTQDTKDFRLAMDVFDKDALQGQCSIAQPIFAG